MLKPRRAHAAVMYLFMATCWSPASSCPAPCLQSAVHYGTHVRRWSWACSLLRWPRCRRERRQEAPGSGGWSFSPAPRRRPRPPAQLGHFLRPDWSEALALNTDTRHYRFNEWWSLGCSLIMYLLWKHIFYVKYHWVCIKYGFIVVLTCWLNLTDLI